MPLTKEWLELEEATGGRAILNGTTEEVRAQYDGLIQMLIPLMPPPSENVESKDGDVDGIKYRTYTPKGAQGPLPIGVWTHGGGMMLGDLDADDLLCRVLSEHAQTTVVGVDYRLSPEHKWPTQLEDSLKIYKWAHSNASSFGGDPQKMFTIGGSAGGSLALCIANVVVKDADLKSSMKGIVSFVPSVAHPDNVPEKYKADWKAYEDNATDSPVITGESMYMFLKAVGSDPEDHSMWALLNEDNHKNFPPTYFASCEFDPLRDDALVMEKALNAAGVKTKHDFWPGLPHYFWIFPQIPQSQEFVGKMLAAVEWLKSQM